MHKYFIYLVIALFFSCKKIKKQEYTMVMIENSGYKTTWKSEVVTSKLKTIEFKGYEINGTLNKSRKEVKGDLIIGNDFPVKYTYTITVTGKITKKNTIEGSYTSDIRSGTFKITGSDWD